MLSKGKVAPSIDRMKKRNDVSTEALYELLAEASKAPALATPKLLAACMNQSTLASFELREFGVINMSLNTLKASANRRIPGGWRRLDELRRNVRSNTVKTTEVRNKTSSDNRKLEVQLLKERLDHAIRTRAILLRAYMDALTILRGAALKDELTSNQLERHSATFAPALGLPVTKGGIGRDA